MEKRVYAEGFPAAGEPIPDSRLTDSPEFMAYAEAVLDEAMRRWGIGKYKAQPDSASGCDHDWQPEGVPGRNQTCTKCLAQQLAQTVSEVQK